MSQVLAQVCRKIRRSRYCQYMVLKHETHVEVLPDRQFSSPDFSRVL